MVHPSPLGSVKLFLRLNSAAVARRKIYATRRQVAVVEISDAKGRKCLARLSHALFRNLSAPSTGFRISRELVEDGLGRVKGWES